MKTASSLGAELTKELERLFAQKSWKFRASKIRGDDDHASFDMKFSWADEAYRVDVDRGEGGWTAQVTSTLNYKGGLGERSLGADDHLSQLAEELVRDIMLHMSH